MTDKQKKKILIVIASDLYVRNYITTDAFSDLEKNYDCYYLSNDSITLKDLVQQKKEHVDFFGIDNVAHREHFKLLEVLMWRYRKRCSTFRFRFLRLINIQLLIWNGNPKEYLRNVASFVRANLLSRHSKVYYSLIFGNKFVFKFRFPSLFYNIPVNQDLKNKVLDVNPDLIIFPSAAYDPTGIDLIQIAKERNIASLFLIDNWDNLSSKSVFYIRPDFLGVWGEQSKKHAIDIHEFKEEQVFEVGTPRFDSYYQVNNKKIPSYFSFEYVLFVGCAIPFDELSALKILDAEISQNPDRYDGLKIIYRPHPWRQRRLKEDFFRECEFKNIILDPQMTAYYQEQKSSISFQPELNYYPSLLSNARFVTGPLTTMLIEASIFYRSVLAIAYNDGIHFTSPHNALKYYAHFQGLEQLEGLSLSKKRSQYAHNFKQVFLTNKTLDRDQLRKSLNYFLYQGKSSYASHIRRKIDKIFDSGRK